MISAFTIVLLILVSILAAPVLLFLIQISAALISRKSIEISATTRSSVAVLMPAHNESQGIHLAIGSVLPQMKPGDRLIVIADNCSDDTARVAAEAGAVVIERHDTARRGKGYALDFGVRHIATSPPEIVVVIDADCIAGEGAIDRLASACAATGQPTQALYLMSAPSASKPMASIAEFAWIVKNYVRPLGYQQLGQPCQLMGTGMGFPWKVLGLTSLANGHIVEDLKMGIELADAGFPPLFCPNAVVTSFFPENREGTKSQRTRWEHGHIGMIVSEAPRYFGRAFRLANRPLMMLILDLCIPPLALLTLSIVSACFMGVIYYMATGESSVLKFASITMGCLTLAVLLAWARFGRKVLKFKQLAYAPIYAIGKIPVYLKFLVSRQVDWVRSKRDQR